MVGLRRHQGDSQRGSLWTGLLYGQGMDPLVMHMSPIANPWPRGPSDQPLSPLFLHRLSILGRQHFFPPFSDPRALLVCTVLHRFSPIQLFATLWTVAHQAPLSMGFLRQECWSGLPSLPGSSVHGILQARILEWVAIPLPGDLPDPRIEPISLTSPALAGRFFTTSTTWEGGLLACSVFYKQQVFTWVRGRAPYPGLCVTSNKCLSTSGPLFPDLYNDRVGQDAL